MTIVCVERAADHTMRAVPIPEPIAVRCFRPPAAAPARLRMTRRQRGQRRGPRSPRAQAERLQALVDALTGAQRASTRASSRPPASTAARGRAATASPRCRCTTKAELIADQDAHAALGQRAHRADRAPTRAITRRRRRPGVRCAGSTPTPAGSGRSTAGNRCSRRPASSPAIGCCSPFSFGPFLGFWTAFEAGCQIGAHCVPGGGMTSHQRLAPDRRRAAGRPLVHADLRAAAGRGRRGRARPRRRSRRAACGPSSSPGRRAAACRRCAPASSAPGARASSITTASPRSARSRSRTGIGRAASTSTKPSSSPRCWTPQGAPVPDGELGELVLTNLGRTASPVIRYRTGDIVRARTAPRPTGPAYLWLDGGILTRADDMVTIRGVNVYPTAVEAVVRAHADVTEFRATVAHESAMRHLTVEIEVRPGADGAAIARGRGAGAEGSARPHRRRARGRRQRPPALRDEGAAFRDGRCQKRCVKP